MTRLILWCGSLLIASLIMTGVGLDAASAASSVRELSAQALLECQRGRVAETRTARLAHFERGQALAERAVALDAGWANAHFALFCTMGEKLRVDGEFLKSIFDLNRVLGALDRTLELDPDHIDALSCKGTFLVRLPGLFGGNRERGEELLRQVIRRAPDETVNARLVLAESYADQDRHDEAIALVREAFAVAQSLQRHDLIEDARSALSRMSAGPQDSPSSHALLARP